MQSNTKVDVAAPFHAPYNFSAPPPSIDDHGFDNVNRINICEWKKIHSKYLIVYGDGDCEVRNLSRYAAACRSCLIDSTPPANCGLKVDS
jgi:hypothetical protein